MVCIYLYIGGYAGMLLARSCKDTLHGYSTYNNFVSDDMLPGFFQAWYFQRRILIQLVVLQESSLGTAGYRDDSCLPFECSSNL